MEHSPILMRQLDKILIWIPIFGVFYPIYMKRVLKINVWNFYSADIKICWFIGHLAIINFPFFLLGAKLLLL